VSRALRYSARHRLAWAMARRMRRCNELTSGSLVLASSHTTPSSVAAVAELSAVGPSMDCPSKLRPRTARTWARRSWRWSVRSLAVHLLLTKTRRPRRSRRSTHARHVFQADSAVPPPAPGRARSVPDEAASRGHQRAARARTKQSSSTSGMSTTTHGQLNLASTLVMRGSIPGTRFPAKAHRAGYLAAAGARTDSS